MWELIKRISLRTWSVLSKVEPEPDLYTGSDQKVPAPTKKYRLRNTAPVPMYLYCVPCTLPQELLTTPFPLWKRQDGISALRFHLPYKMKSQGNIAELPDLDGFRYLYFQGGWIKIIFF